MKAKLHHCQESSKISGYFMPNGWAACGGLYPRRTTMRMEDVTCAKCLKWCATRFGSSSKPNAQREAGAVATSLHADVVLPATAADICPFCGYDTSFRSITCYACGRVIINLKSDKDNATADRQEEVQ